MDRVDLGSDHFLTYFCWKPDRDLNSQYAGIADVEKAGATIEHLSKVDGSPCISAVQFKTDHSVFNKPQCWNVESYDPLTLSPSILCKCGDHGFIRDGKWVTS